MAAQEIKPYSKGLELTAHSAWSQAFWDKLLPAKDRISQHPFFVGFASGQLTPQCVRYALLNFYPLVAHFPSYMALNLAKATDFHLPGVTDTRTWLIQNIKVEERHLFWYQDWAAGFGLSVAQLNQVCPPPAMDAVNHFLWSTNYRCELAVGIAATNLAIEWATSDWTVQVYKGIKSYTNHADIVINNKTLAWLRAHALYDDVHPYEAMELIKRLCDHDPEMQQKALLAAEQGLAYYELALDECYKVQLAKIQQGGLIAKI
ncbi:MAG: iron-containing redox enzyme family protein [Aquirhabdus sp.]